MRSGASSGRTQLRRLFWFCLLVCCVLSAGACVLPQIDDPVEVCYQRGLRLRDAGDLRGALREFQATVRLQPESASAFYEMGKIYEDLGQLPEAAQAFRRAV